MKPRILLKALAFCCCFTLMTGGLYAQTPEGVQAEALAFPGAAGFGKHSVGGRGGKIFEVTDLADTNDFVDHGTHWTGTFRAGCESINEPRILVFKVSGTITLGKYLNENTTDETKLPYWSGVTIKNPYITIACNTAPGEGVVFKGGMISIETHDVIIRHLRHFIDIKRSLKNLDSSNMFMSGSVTKPTYNVIIDHCTAAWATGDTVGNSNDCYDVSWTNNMIAEGIQHGANPNAFAGGMMASAYSNHQVANGGHTTFYRNFMVGFTKRAPLSGNGIKVDIVNNVVQQTHLKTIFQCFYAPAEWNWVSNYYMDSPGFYNPKWDNYAGAYYRNCKYLQDSTIYYEGNYNPAVPEYTQDELIERVAVDGTSDDPKVSATRLPWGDTYPGELDAESAAASVTDFETGAGAHKTCGSDGVFVNGRNSFETRILNNFYNNTGDYVLRDPLTETAQKSVPAPTPGATPYSDANHDGIPDAYILPAGKVATDLRTDGYTFVEGFLWEAEKYW